jgi:hypothetical protein
MTLIALSYRERVALGGLAAHTEGSVSTLLNCINCIEL